MSKTFIRLSAAYMEEPITMRSPNSFKHVDLEALPISEELKLTLSAWDGEYQDTFNHDYPPDSDFATSELKDAHNRRGEELSVRLQSELGGNYRVIFKKI